MHYFTMIMQGLQVQVDLGQILTVQLMKRATSMTVDNYWVLTMWQLYKPSFM